MIVEVEIRGVRAGAGPLAFAAEGPAVELDGAPAGAAPRVGRAAVHVAAKELEQLGAASLRPGTRVGDRAAVLEPERSGSA